MVGTIARRARAPRLCGEAGLIYGENGDAMSRLTDLLRVAKQLDPQLGADLEDELKPLQKRLPFGLNFERHAPEAVELPGHKIRRTSKVRVLPPRGSSARGDKRLWRVESIDNDLATIVLLDAAAPEFASVQLDDLVLVAEFRDRIYPGLRSDGEIVRGGDKPFHTVINGENFHVLEQLTFTHENAVDAIYIDPPYNTGSKDWKYNNDYVEGDDLYRHSKWLAFMERRLKIAKRLLKPADSVLIVTIDEKEYLRLGLLLEQTFPEARIQMISSMIAQKGVARGSQFYRTDEYIYFVQLGASAVLPLPLSTDWALGKGDGTTGAAQGIVWSQLRRSGTNSLRSDRPGLFYPVFIDPVGPRIVGAGFAPAADERRDPAETTEEGWEIAWPLRPDGSEANWQVSPKALLELADNGYARVGRKNENGYPISYLKRGSVQKITSGQVRVLRRDADTGQVVVDASEYQREFIPGTQWNIASHDATYHGSQLLNRLLGAAKFPFPKSLYAVEDTLRFFVADKPNAVVLDFFAGSGTTAHALMRLNRQDDGRRQCISVTNNEVSAEEQSRLRKDGLRPGDLNWERLGICEYITKPRVRAAISGRTDLGESLIGDYKFIDEFPMASGFEENAAFFTLTYESQWMVSSDRAFEAIAPMLWLRAGAQGERIDDLSSGWAVSKTYGILRDLDQAFEFVSAIRKLDGLRLAYIVTDDEGRYQQVADELRGVETVRLYEDYLRNCENLGDL
jgi:adenine-specific DNA-methyltransferase